MKFLIKYGFRYPAVIALMLIIFIVHFLRMLFFAIRSRIRGDEGEEIHEEIKTFCQKYTYAFSWAETGK